MNRFLLLAATLLIGTSAFAAYPALYDTTDYSGQLTTNGVQHAIALRFQASAFDAATATYDVTQSISYDNGTPQTNVQKQEAKDMFSNALYGQYIQYCGQIGGKLETVTVAAGTFDTCAAPVNQNGQTGTTWVGNVPFGIVKTQITDTKNNLTYAFSLTHVTQATH